MKETQALERGSVSQASEGTLGDQATRARLEAHNAMQWLARLAHSYSDLSAEEVQLRWSVKGRRIVTPDVAPGIAAHMSLAPLTLQFEEAGQPVPHPIEVDGKSSTEIEAWVLVELFHRGFDRDRFSKRLPYDLPHLMSGDETKYSSEDLADELRLLQRQFEQAAEALQDVRRALVADTGAAPGPGVSPDLFCSPERFDIAFVIPTFGDDPKGGLTKIGFTAGDHQNHEPRYFVARASEAQGTLALSSEPLPAPVSSSTTNRAELIARLVQQANVLRNTTAN